MKTTRIRTFYQADPVGTVPGGIDTFIRGLVKWAPDDLSFSLIGMTTEADKRPVGRWTRCDLGRRQFDFFPVFSENKAGEKPKVPWTLRLCLNAIRYRSEVLAGFDVAEFHRIEPLLLFKDFAPPANGFFHQDMSILHNRNSDMLWKMVPKAYFWLENHLASRMDSMFCVREAGALALQRRFPKIANHIRFIPTWVDTEVFSPPKFESQREDLRLGLRRRLGVAENTRLIVTVGRVDSQKNPDLLLDAFAILKGNTTHDVALVFIGDGVLRPSLKERAHTLGLQGSVFFPGLMAQSEIADALGAADVFALSSSYEGMPMALLEALGSGLPVVTTDVGEVRRVVSSRCGVIIENHEPETMALALRDVLANLENLRGTPCLRAIERFTPAEVLDPVYENYRRLGHIGWSKRPRA